MADGEREDVDETASSLELPSLGSLLRRRRRPRTPTTDAESSYDDSAEEEVEAEADPVPPVVFAESSYDDSAKVEVEAAEPGRRRRRKRTRRRIRIHLPGEVVALLTGLVVGAALVGLTAGGLRVCSAVRGTPSCGNAGILLLLLIAVVATLLGSLILRLSGVDAHGSTSLLGVGLLVVLVLVGLLPVLDDWWVTVVVPALAMLTFVASWWLTTTYVEPGERAR